MEKVVLESKVITGISTITDNASEMSSEGSKIGKLWQQFYTLLAQAKQLPSTAYGVYSNYESDQHGIYTITAGQESALQIESEKEVTIPAGTYLKFSAEGKCPEVCIELWQEVWNFFETEDAPKRLFTVDFEVYTSLTTVEIYIAIEE